ncbi:MAG: hypothetical protein V3U52_01430 [Thermoplasmata archaeon]
MAIRAWLLALQAPLFMIVLIPALVGAAAAWREGATIVPGQLGIVLLALVMVQAGANLQKGLRESADRRGGPSDHVPSIFIYDSGSVEALGWSRSRLGWLTLAFFATGGLAGAYLLFIHRDPVLLALVVAGAILSFFYNAPPLKFSFRGISEIPTFLAFGPLLVMGVAYLFSGAFLESAFWAGVIMGFLASLIYYERYFPVALEDEGRGKRTPVVILGPEGATKVLWRTLTGPYLIALIFGFLGERSLLLFMATLPLGVAFVHFHLRALLNRDVFGISTGLAVLLHVAGGTLLALGYLL